MSTGRPGLMLSLTEFADDFDEGSVNGLFMNASWAKQSF